MDLLLHRLVAGVGLTAAAIAAMSTVSLTAQAATGIASVANAKTCRG
ncbi:hypothetical protein ACWEOZ_00025 [Actinoplanes sp. NPDC004185]